MKWFTKKYWNNHCEIGADLKMPEERIKLYPNEIFTIRNCAISMMRRLL